MFNASSALMERAEMMVLHEGMTCEPDTVKRTPYARRLLNFIYRITDTPSKKMVRNIKNKWAVEIWLGIVPDSTAPHLPSFNFIHIPIRFIPYAGLEDFGRQRTRFALYFSSMHSIKAVVVAWVTGCLTIRSNI